MLTSLCAQVYLLVLSVTTLSLLLAPVLWRVTTHRWVPRAERKTVTWPTTFFGDNRVYIFIEMEHTWFTVYGRDVISILMSLMQLILHYEDKLICSLSTVCTKESQWHFFCVDSALWTTITVTISFSCNISSILPIFDHLTYLFFGLKCNVVHCKLWNLWYL